MQVFQVDEKLRMRFSNFDSTLARMFSTRVIKIDVVAIARPSRSADETDPAGGDRRSAREQHQSRRNVIESLRRKSWLERATWGEYLLIPPEQGPDALGDSNLLALASRIADPYYIGF